MAVDRSRQFSGVLQNIDVKKIPDIGHFNIDTNQTLQQRMIWEIRAAIYADCNAAPTSPVSTLQIGAGSVKSPDGGRLARRFSGVLPPRPPLERAAEIDPSRRLAARLRCNATRAACSVQLSRLIALPCITQGAGAGAVARTRILRRLIEREPVEPNDLFPGQQVGETAAHRPNMDGRAFPALLNCQTEIFASTAFGSRNT